MIKVLSDLMEHDNLQVRTHINGTMYSVLTRQALKDEANQLGLGEMLDYLIQAQQDKSYAGEAEEQMQRQMQYIYNQLVAEPSAEDEQPDQDAQNNSDVEDGDDDFEDPNIDDDQEASEDEIFEDEEDLNDSMRRKGVPIGEEWLTSQFLLANNEALSQTVAISQKLQQENKDKLNRSDISRNNRPISPFVSGADGNPFQ